MPTFRSSAIPARSRAPTSTPTPSSRPTTSTRSPANPALNLTFATPAAVVHGLEHREDHRDRPEPGRRSARRAGRHQGDRGLQRAGATGAGTSRASTPTTRPTPTSRRARRRRTRPAARSRTAATSCITTRPQYFGYLADNPQVLNSNLHGAKDFFDAVEGRTLPARRRRVLSARRLRQQRRPGAGRSDARRSSNAFLGNDDHPAYSDQQISEAFAAEAINDIANSPYWSQSAIIITYDETDGFYDHVSPENRSTFADGSPLAAGPRIPDDRDLALRRVRHDLASLQRARLGHQVHQRVERPRAARRAAGRKERAACSARPTSARTNLGPSDDPDNDVGDLTEAFDYDSLRGDEAADPGFGGDVHAGAGQDAAASGDARTIRRTAIPTAPAQAIGILPTDFESCRRLQERASRSTRIRPTSIRGRPSRRARRPRAAWTP